MDFEEILAQLTQSQIDFLVANVRDGMRPAVSQDDHDKLIHLKLFEYPDLGDHADAYTADRISSPVRGVSVPSELGRDFVEWYLALPEHRKRKN